ncbi:MAG: Acetyl-CoA synthetase [Candidatus Levybacteria bacterium GW2011_GWA2_40_8]|nr:MAG: Acetyl-CoA synthetase [Candidatus Levybacteria bacterium GW2011_GWA2_40_8]
MGNSGAKILITTTDLQERVDKVRRNLPRLKEILTVDGDKFKTLLAKSSDDLKITETNAEDPAFMLYTSGTTGKPKGIVHVHKAILHEQKTAQLALDIKDTDIYWCTADPGWVTGIAYEILGTWSIRKITVKIF